MNTAIKTRNRLAKLREIKKSELVKLFGYL